MAIPQKLKININLVFFFFLAFALIYAMATQVLSVLQDRYTVNAIFPDAGGVFTNQEVTYRGVTVGQVGALDVVQEGVNIQLLIDEGVEIPAEGVEARVMFKSAVGEQFVDLLPASNSAPYLEDGDEIPLAQTSIPVSTQELLSTLEAVLRGVPPEALKGAVDSLGLGLTGEGEDLATIIESMADLAELFAERGDEVVGILENGVKFGRAANATAEEFSSAVHDLVSVSESLSGSTPDLHRLLTGTNLASEQVIGLIEENRPALNKVLIDLGIINDLQAEHAGDIARLLEQLPKALANVNKAFEEDTGLVRFGLIQETEAHGCSYGTERRRPSERGERLPPKKANCGEGGGILETPDLGEAPGSSTSSLSTLLGGDSAADTDQGIAPALLSGRLAHWSWSLFYLNGF